MCQWFKSMLFFFLNVQFGYTFNNHHVMMARQSVRQSLTHFRVCKWRLVFDGQKSRTWQSDIIQTATGKWTLQSSVESMVEWRKHLIPFRGLNSVVFSAIEMTPRFNTPLFLFFFIDAPYRFPYYATIGTFWDIALSLSLSLSVFLSLSLSISIIFFLGIFLSLLLLSFLYITCKNKRIIYFHTPHAFFRTTPLMWSMLVDWTIHILKCPLRVV